MSFDQLQRTYQAAAQRYNDEALRLYVRLPAVRNASPAQLQQLMQLSLELCGAAFTQQQRSVSSNMAGVNTLCSFQQAQQLSADMIEELLEATFGVMKQAPAATPLLGKVWPLLCQLPQAQHIQPATILAWLGQSLSQERHQAAAALAVLLDQAETAWGGLTGEEVEQLLARALPVAKRGSVQGLKATCSMQCVRSVVGTSAVVRLLDAALVFKGLRACREPAAAATLLLQLPAAAGLPAGDLARLCGGVVEQCSDGEVCEELLQLLLGTGCLPGPEELVSLLTACLHNRTDKSAAACIQLLCSDATAQQVDGAAAQQLLLEAVEAQQPAAMLVLLACLLAAPQSSEHVQQLLRATVLAALQCYKCQTQTRDLQDNVARSWMKAVEAVAGVVAAHGVSADLLLLLLKQAVEQGALGMVQQLVRVRTLQQPQKEQLGSLLQLAAQQQQREGLQALLLLLPDAASSLTAEQMTQLLHASVQKDDHRMVALLCGMSSAQLLQPQQVTGLLAAAVRHAKLLTSALLLCKLPAASMMTATPTAGLIDDAQAALSGIRAALEKDKADSFSISTKRMMRSMPFSVYSRKRAGNALSPSQVARQTAAATGAVQAEQKVPLRVWLGMQVVAALQELQAAATHDM